ncbi:helix-turn-helix domain-containing protein [Candidatus Pacearchaeota archaeon]|nr:helix-turn-helix domain-containing protein [Candidatus Pacearchaeota archaeon]
MNINPYEANILRILLKYKIFLSTRSIAQKSKMSWNTAEKYLLELEQRGWVVKRGKTLKYWKVVIEN